MAPTKLFNFEIAKSNRSTCSECYNALSQGSSKLCVGASRKSCHIHCVTRSMYDNMVIAFGSIEDAPGYDDLSPGNMAVLGKFVKGDLFQLQKRFEFWCVLSEFEMSKALILAHFEGVDKKLAGLVKEYKLLEDGGSPSKDNSCFQTLCTAILNQQLALKAAATIVERFKALFGKSPPSPQKLLKIPDEQLRTCGISARKCSYIKDLATHFNSGSLSDKILQTSPDDQVRDLLIRVKGIGPWTVDMFLMFHLDRPDVCPIGDLGFRRGAKKYFGVPEKTSDDVIMERCEVFRPYRSVAARVFWKFGAVEKVVREKKGK